MPALPTVIPLKIPTLGSQVSIDVIIGQAQYGEYRVRLFDSAGKNPQEIGEGNNVDTLPDSFDVPNAPPGLKGRLISWRITIASPSAPDGQFYYARIIVREGNRSLSDVAIEYAGPLDGAKILIGFGDFSV